MIFAVPINKSNGRHEALYGAQGPFLAVEHSF